MQSKPNAGAAEAGRTPIEPSDTGFNEEEFDSAYPEGIEYHYWTAARNKIVEKQLTSAGVGKQSRILEIGCGKGVVVDYFKKKGYDCWGVELAPIKTMESVREVVVSGKDACQLPPATRERFQVLLLLDVVEHLSAPEDFLANIIRSFPNVETVMLTVPAGKELWSNYDEHYRHFRRYDLEMMGDLMKRIGGQVNRMHYFFHGLYIPAKLLLKFQNQRPVQIRAPQGLARKMHALLTWIFYADACFLPGGWKGTSILCCGRIPRATRVA